MSASDLPEYVQQLRLDAETLSDVRVREVVGKVLNLVEDVLVEDRRLREEKQRLEEIVRRLQGGRAPGASSSRPPARDGSSEKERRRRAPRSGGSRRSDRRSFRDIRVDEEVVRPVDAARLPADATFVGYDDVVVQDLHIQSHNVRYRLEIWDSPSQGRVRGELPPGVRGEYGPELKALLVSLKYVAGTSLPRAQELVEHFGHPLESSIARKLQAAGCRQGMEQSTMGKVARQEEAAIVVESGPPTRAFSARR